MVKKKVNNCPKAKRCKYECIDVMVAMFGVEAVKHFCMCNAYKYSSGLIRRTVLRIARKRYGISTSLLN